MFETENHDCMGPIRPVKSKEAALARENAELREGLKFVQLERDNRTSAYEIGVKLIGELQASNARLREVLTSISAARSNWQQNVGSFAGGETYAAFAARLQQMATNALAETPATNLEAIRAEAKAEEREACVNVITRLKTFLYGVAWDAGIEYIINEIETRGITNDQAIIAGSTFLSMEHKHQAIRAHKAVKHHD